MSAFPVRVLILFFEHHAIVHKGEVPFAGIGCIEGFRHKGKDFGILDALLALKKAVDKNPPYVCLDKDDGLVEGEGTDCAGGCPANSR